MYIGDSAWTFTKSDEWFWLFIADSAALFFDFWVEWYDFVWEWGEYVESGVHIKVNYIARQKGKCVIAKNGQYN